MFLFFMQKTAYEMRISDWSSDVCSSDLVERQHAGRRLGDAAEGADEVDLDDPVERVEREMPDAAFFLAAARGLDRIAGAGAVDQDAFLTMRLARLGEGRVDRSVVGDVAFTENAGDLVRDGDALFLLQVEDRDLDALGGQRARGRGAKARGAPGDDGGYGGVEFHLVLPNRSEEHTSELQSLMRISYAVF